MSEPSRPHGGAGGAPVLLTGASGFIGQRLHRHLLELGYPVRALVRPASAGAAGLDPRCELIRGELTDPAAMTRALAGAAAVIYAAGSVRGARLEHFHPANVAGVSTLAQALAALPAGVSCPVLLISSLAASRPDLSHYARSKSAGEAVLRAAPELPWSILRPPAVYGPGDVEMRGLLALVRRGLALRPGPPEQRLALLHVDDLVSAIAAWLAAPAACTHGCYAIDDGTPGGYRWYDIGIAVAGRPVRQLGLPGWLLRGVAGLNQRLAAALGYAPMLTPGKVRELQQPAWLCDNSPFTQATGWRPRVDLAQGAADLFR